MEVWTGKRAGVEGAKGKFGADYALEMPQLKYFLTSMHTNDLVTKVYFVPSDTNKELNEKVSKELESPVNWSEEIARMRLVKTEEEIKLIRHAIAITIEGYEEMIKPWPAGTNEGELQAVHECAIRRRGALRLAFPTVVASGNNATTLHYFKNDSEIKPGDLILVDSGAEYGNYAADITRTWPASGYFSQEQKSLYQIVYEAQEAVMNAIRPGATLAEIHEVSEKIIEEGLRRLGILSEDSTQEDVRHFYPTYFGHHMGLDVHDGYDGSIDYNELKELKLEPNMVITNEPGIYIAEDDERVDPMWRGIGIRIEDDILVTQEGCENLTKDLPRSPGVLEVMIQSQIPFEEY